MDPRGLYTGDAQLTGFRGDCNAGGTGWLKVGNDQSLSYADALNGSLSGMLGPDGKVDLARGSVRLIGDVQNGRFKGKVSGGVCDYTYSFSREAAQEKEEFKSR